jgi:DNA-binding transcriptional ArsR family regulator
MRRLASSPDVSPDGDPRVVGLDSEEADELIAAFPSSTARRILAALHDDPAPSGELADRVDTTLQNAQYHLE